IFGIAPDQDHLVAAVHGSLAPRLGDAPVVLVPVDAQVTLAAWHFLVLPVTAHDAHRTKGLSAKLGNFGPVQPVQRMPRRRGAPQPPASTLGRRGRPSGARPCRSSPPGAPLSAHRMAATWVSAGTGHPATPITGRPCRERHPAGSSPPGASSVYCSPTAPLGLGGWACQPP